MKIGLIANAKFTITNFRKELIERLLAEGHKVVAICPLSEGQNLSELDSHAEYLSGLGLKFIDFPLERTSFNVFNNFSTLWKLKKILALEKLDIIINFTIKPVIFGSLAGYSCKIPYIFSNITGLGYVFIGQGRLSQVIRFIISLQYKVALRLNRKVFFQNPDDANLFLKRRLVCKKQICILSGSGINLNEFRPEFCAAKERRSFLLIARLIWDKGIGEYVEAARILKAKYPDANFYLLGTFDSNPKAISREYIDKCTSEGVITYLGHDKDVKKYLAKYEVYVLPSYREGTPRSTLEAMAMGMPVITADVPGCRETVISEENGLLVPVRNVPQLASAMERFIQNPDLAAQMGAKSLELVQKKFDVRQVNKVIIDNIFAGQSTSIPS